MRYSSVLTGSSAVRGKEVMSCLMAASFSEDPKRAEIGIQVVGRILSGSS